MQFTITKEELQKLDQETTYIRIAKEELQELDHQQSNLHVVKTKTKKNQVSRMDAKWHLGRDVTDELYD